MAIRFDFAGKSVLVTGGSQGMGLGVARAFLEVGAVVHVTGTGTASGDYVDDLSSIAHAGCRRLRRDSRCDANARCAGQQCRNGGRRRILRERLSRGA
jgi:3-oxoacyl-[acyl-carrier protein] reductase